ncbi:MAG: orotidine 5'-phosphate decarboxylase / HUMPS family protein [Nanoarchaeota archaeon]|nr:orotidine 5'-phosphate decarboxylase / HUMPS family protein [Nanoarchaeota archaeon]
MIIARDRSVIPACDVETLDELKRLVKATCAIEGIGAYKIGFELVIPYGMKQVIEEIRTHSDLPIIYDHQKAGTDIPDTGEKFMRACSHANAVIIFPQAGPVTEEAWILAAQKKNMPIIVGGEMTHAGYLASEKGFLSDDMPERAYKIAAKLGVSDYVVPGNKPDKILKYRKMLEKMGITPVFYSPGLIAQGGSLTEGAEAAGPFWHAIVGRGIYGAKDMEKAAKELVKEIL